MPTDSPSSAASRALPILTARLRIRPLRQDDLDAMHAVYSDPECTRFIPRGVRDLEGTRQRVAELIKHHDRHGVSKWAVEIAGTGEVIGDCGLQFLPGTSDLELGFHLAKAHWGRGYATEAATACLQWAQQHRHERIIAIVDPNHHASQHVLENLGMRSIGTLYLFDRNWLVYEAERHPHQPAVGQVQ